MGAEAMARRSEIELWAKSNGLGSDFLSSDIIWNEDGTATVEGSLMLANTEATKLPEGLILLPGDEVYVRADQSELKDYLNEKGLVYKVIADPRSEDGKMAA